MHDRGWIALLTLLGFGLTATNGILAYRGAKRRLQQLGRRITSSTRYASEEAGAPPEPSARHVERSAHEAADAVLHALQSTRTNLLLAGLGLLVSATASTWALYG